MPAVETDNPAATRPDQREVGGQTSTARDAECIQPPKEAEVHVSMPEKRIQRERIEQINPKMLPIIRQQGLDTHWQAADDGGAELMTATTGMPIKCFQANRTRSRPKTVQDLPPFQAKPTDVADHGSLSRVRTSLGLILLVLLLLVLLIVGL